MGKSFGQHLAAASLVLLATTAAPAWALSQGMSDTFQGGIDGGWSMGASSILPPTVVPSGGPAGAGDGYLSAVSIGGLGANSRMTLIAGPQWSGNYLAAGIDRITMDLKNLGSTDLSLRLFVINSLGASAISTAAVTLPANGDWTQASFLLDAGSLSGQPVAALSDALQLRLFHGSAASFPGDAIAGSLGIDNVTAVPEPGAAWLMLAGLAGLALRRAR